MLLNEIRVNKEADMKQTQKIKDFHDFWGVFFEDKRPDIIEN